MTVTTHQTYARDCSGPPPPNMQQTPPSRSCRLLPPQPGSSTPALPTGHRALGPLAAAGAALARGTLARAQAPAASGSPGGTPRVWAGSSLPRGSAREPDPATARTKKATTSLSGEGASNICGALAGPRMKCATCRVKPFLAKPSVFPTDATLKPEQLLCLPQTNMPNNEVQRDH